MDIAKAHRHVVDLQRELGSRSFAAFCRMAWAVIIPDKLVWGWHNDALCEHAQAVTQGEIRDLVVSVPPGTTKSVTLSSLWPAWNWIRNPTDRVIAATYAQSLSEKNARLQRNLVASPWFQERWGDRVTFSREEVAKVREFANTAGGWRFTTSVEGEATGRHGDRLLGDDLSRAQDAQGRSAVDPVAIEKANAFWFQTLYTRRANALTTSRVLIAQRLHSGDTPGLALEAGYMGLILPMEFDPRRRCSTSFPRMQPDGTCVEITWEDPRTEAGQLLAPTRFPREVVDADRERMGPAGFAAQMQQDPTPAEGLLFCDAGQHRYTVLPDRPRFILTCDAAFKDKKSSDYVSIQVWAAKQPNFYLVANDTRHLGFGGTMQAILDMLGRFPQVVGVYVEDKANGPAIIETLSASVPGVVAWQPGSESKTARAEAMAPLFAAGNVWLPRDEDAPWISSYLTEIRRFPLAKHDDQVDATVMALRILHEPMVSLYAAAVRKMAR